MELKHWVLIWACQLLWFDDAEGKKYEYRNSRENLQCTGKNPYAGLIKETYCSEKEGGKKCQNDKSCPTGQTCACNEFCEEFRCKKNKKKTFLAAIAKCAGNCSGHGNIVQNASGQKTCNCSQGYTGRKCEIICNVTCIFGDCVVDTNGNSCKCKPGYSGEACDKRFDYCLPNPCLNGSVCSQVFNISGIKYKCLCTENFTGTYCNETKCSMNCTKDTICAFSTDKTQYCKCNKPGFSGKNCENDINECQLYNKICSGHGICNNTIGAYKCTCNEGWEGERCENKINYCKSNPCKNNGSCTVGNTYYQCTCTKGYEGKNCQNFNPCLKDLCQNGGTCTNNGTCLCTKSFTGQNCETSIDVCKNVHCNNGECINEAGKGKCNCTKGFEGEYCKNEINLCAQTPCANGGTCFSLKGFDFSCNCPSGFTGKDCSKRSNRCGCVYGTCSTNNICDCQQGWKGPLCDIQTCPYTNCTIVEGQCDEKCNNELCDFGGNYTCSLGVDPYEKCPKKICATLGNNGVCDNECNSAQCTFDAGECITRGACKWEELCRGNYNDSNCDPSCDTEECGWDNLSCSKKNTKKAKGKLIMIVGGTLEHFKEKKSEFERDLSILLNSHVVVVEMEEISSSRRVRRAVDGGPRLKVKTTLDNRECKHNCFNTAEEAANFLAIKKSKKQLKLPVALYRVSSEDEKKNKPNEPFPPIWIAFLVAFPILLIGVMYKAKKVHTRLWRPEMSSQETPGTRMEPVGHENEIRSVDESPDRSKRIKLDILDSSEFLTTLPQTPFLLSPGNEHRNAYFEHPLLNAVSKDDLNTFREYIDNSDVNTRDRNGRTALHLSLSMCLNNCNIFFNMLIRHRAINPDVPDNSGQTPLMLACKYRSFIRQVEELITLGCKVTTADKQGQTALHIAAQIDNYPAANLLIKHGAKVDAPDNKMRTPLFLCAMEASHETAFILTSNYASKSSGDIDDQTPLTIAKRNGDKKMIMLLSDCANSPGKMIPSPQPYPDIRPKLIDRPQPKPTKRPRKSKDRKTSTQDDLQMVGSIAPMNFDSNSLSRNPPLNQKENFPIFPNDYANKIWEPETCLKEIPGWCNPQAPQVDHHQQSVITSRFDFSSASYPSPFDTPESVIDAELSPLSDSIPNIMTPPPSWTTSPESDYSDK